MNDNNIMKLTDFEVIEELKVFANSLRTHLETLLEDSDDEDLEKSSIQNALEELVNLFTVLNWKRSANYTSQALKASASISAFGEDDAEKYLLHYCLVLEEALESFEDLGFISEDDITEEPNLTLSEESEEINVSLLKVLRTLYQKQLLLLIKNNDKSIPLHALNALSRDISSILPIRETRNWLLLSFYIQALVDQEGVCGVDTHRILAQLDTKLSSLIAKHDVHDEVCADLIKHVSALKNGQEFIEHNVLTQDIYSISPIVYKRFGLAIKDELVKTHELLERIYLDHGQRARLEEVIPFFNKLKNVLVFMGLKRLSLLTEGLIKDFNHLLVSNVDHNEFNEIVSQFWVLESFLSSLWSRREQIVPLSYNEAKNWAYLSAKQTTLKLFVMEYHKIREQITNESDDHALVMLQNKLLDTVRAEQVLPISNPLSKYFVSNFMSIHLSKNDLLEVALAIEYISNMNMENRASIEEVFYSAKAILQQHVKDLNQTLDNSAEVALDADVVEALSEDLQGVQYEFDQLMAQRPLNQSHYDDMIRIVHTLRGNANIVKLTDLAQLAEVLEDNMSSNLNYDDEAVGLYAKTLSNILEQFKLFLVKAQ